MTDYNDAKKELEEEALEDGDGHNTPDQPARQNTGDNYDNTSMDEFSPEVSRQVVNATEEVLKDIYEERGGELDVEEAVDEVRREVYNRLGDADTGIMRLEEDRDAYEQEVERVTRTLYATTAVLDQEIGDRQELGNLIETVRAQSLREYETTFEGTGSDWETVRECEDIASRLVDGFSPLDLDSRFPEQTGRDNKNSNTANNGGEYSKAPLTRKTEGTSTRSEGRDQTTPDRSTGFDAGKALEGEDQDVERTLEIDEANIGNAKVGDVTVGKVTTPEEDTDDDSSGAWYNPFNWF